MAAQTSTKPVVVYGASGYTGRLVCEYLRELNVPFVAAGRDKDRVQEVVGRIPGIETADVEVVAGRAHRRGADRAVHRRAGRLQHRRPVHHLRPGGRRGRAGRRLPLPRHDRRAGLGARRAGAVRARRTPSRGCCSPPASRRCTRPARSRRTSRWRRPGSTRSTCSCCGRASRPWPRRETIFTILKADWFHLQENAVRQGRADGDVRGRRARLARDRAGRARGAAPATRSGSRTTRGSRASRSPAA